ncbi:MAG: arginine repressor [Firmicutes bacterium HGW-Firmicutes-14]|nr:MAG: arginine repressor [Firmicutes bacterium HGW-Firmicutes-14]
MKTGRHRKIIEIIERMRIETQEELAEELKREGFDVTQATVSRDIKELRLVKVAAGNDRYRYALPGERLMGKNPQKSMRVFRDSVIGLDSSENIIVVRTTPGAAQAAALVIDNEGWEEIIGTVAGDDTVLVVVKPKSAVAKVMDRFKSFLT